MYLTQEADYAVRIVYSLCKGAKRRDAKTIGKEVGVTSAFALKILGKLVAAGIVKSFKGNGGGYELAKAPEEVSLLDVISTIEGPPRVCRCVGGSCSTLREESCPFYNVYKEASDMLIEKFGSVNFGQV